jgi:hypothetical protein
VGRKLLRGRVLGLRRVCRGAVREFIRNDTPLGSRSLLTL